MTIDIDDKAWNDKRKKLEKKVQKAVADLLNHTQAGRVILPLNEEYMITLVLGKREAKPVTVH